MSKAHRYHGHRNSIIPEACAVPLMALFSYTSSTKLLNFSEFRSQMHSQTILTGSADLLLFLIPAIEVAIVVLLCSGSFRSVGFVAAAVLMLLFTTYAGMAAAGLFSQMPCACGGVLHHMGWKTHFLFNLFFLLLSCLGIYTSNRERSVIGKE